MHLHKAIWKALASDDRQEATVSVMFPGPLPPRLEELNGLASKGVIVERLPDSGDVHWAVRLTHRVWGSAEALCTRNPLLPPREMIDPCLNLTPDEKDAIGNAGSDVIVVQRQATPNPLECRKRLFRFARAIMSDYGVAVADHLSCLFWSRQSLDEELAHDADLDVAALHVMHAVQSGEPETVNWLHSHGLAAIGFFDFDILKPSPAVLGWGSDVLRAIAYGIVEGEIQSSMPSFRLAEPGGVVSFVEAAHVAQHAAPDILALWDPDDEHRRNHSVLCEPSGDGRHGRWGRFFHRASNKLKPSVFLSDADTDGVVITFSTEATNSMAARARATYDVFRSLFGEFRDLELPICVKLGFPTDTPGKLGNEHLWFVVHELFESSIDATLANQPFHVSTLRLGERGTHSVELLTDWRILSPAGSMTPRNVTAARQIRQDREGIRKIMRDAQP